MSATTKQEIDWNEASAEQLREELWRIKRELTRTKEEREEAMAFNDKAQKHADGCLKAMEVAAWEHWKAGHAAIIQAAGHELMRMKEWYPVPHLHWHQIGPHHWRALWNNVDGIGGYCDDPDLMAKSGGGVATYWGNTKFDRRMASGDEAKAAIEAKFREWVHLAASVVPPLGAPPHVVECALACSGINPAAVQGLLKGLQWALKTLLSGGGDGYWSTVPGYCEASAALKLAALLPAPTHHFPNQEPGTLNQEPASPSN